MIRFLGKRPARWDDRTLRLLDYVSPSMPLPPPAVRWDRAVKRWGVLGNNQYGNCVIATAGHMINTWIANDAKRDGSISDDAAIQLSRRMGALRGYVVLDRLNWWWKNGMWGHEIAAYASLLPELRESVQYAVALFGACDVGLRMPLAWQNQTVWSTGKGNRFRAGSWGGHSVPIIGYDADHCYLVTWGHVQTITWSAVETYCDEAYAVISPDWMNEDQRNPVGFDYETLRAVLASITSS
jgi:hypothetical protein